MGKILRTRSKTKQSPFGTAKTEKKYYLCKHEPAKRPHFCSVAPSKPIFLNIIISSP